MEGSEGLKTIEDVIGKEENIVVTKRQRKREKK